MGCPRGCCRLWGERGKSHPATRPGTMAGVPRAAPSGERGGKSHPKLFPPGKGTQPPAAEKVLRKEKGYPPKYSGKFGRCSTHPPGHPLPVGTERGERGRERVGEGVPTTKLFLLLLRQLGKKKTELIWGSKERAGLDKLGHIRVHLYVMPCARGHGCCHPIDYGSPATGKIRPQSITARDGPKELFLMTNCLVRVPLLVLARWGGQRPAAPRATGQGQE